METKGVNIGDLIELTNGKFLVVKSYTKDGLMERGCECNCHIHCYLARIQKCKYIVPMGGHVLPLNTIKNIEQYDLYSGNCPLASGLYFEELEGGI